MNILVTCEHGGKHVPAPYREIFVGKKQLLNSHRGYDKGALFIAGALAGRLKAALFYSTLTRLLIDLNRSPHHRTLFSEMSRQLDAVRKNHLMDTYYLPYRRKVEESIMQSLSNSIPLLHIAVHTFAPVIRGKQRNADVGLLYDPSRPVEKVFCKDWRDTMKQEIPELKIRRNYPYLGKTDGLVTSMRRKGKPHLYIGVELEINQKILRKDNKLRRGLLDALVSGIHSGMEKQGKRFFHASCQY